jgi:linoleoyl-CoA desaturase
MPVPAKLIFTESSAFHHDLKTRVDAYFASTHQEPAASAGQWVKTAFWLALTWGSYAALLLIKPAFPASLLLFALVGFGLACIGFNVGHDAIHGAVSRKPWVNKVFGWSFDMMGASSAMWNLQHNIMHHTYTNVQGVDDDIEPGPLLRFYDRPDVYWFHRFQHLYCWFLYSLVGLLWVYHKDFYLAWRKDLRTGKRAPLRDVVSVVIGKVMHLAIFLAVPLLVLGNPVATIVGYLVMCCTAGFTLAIVFQLAHAVEGVVAPPLAPGQTAIADGWADNQMRTTADFGTTWLATFITGGLDHQIEHHLFPRVAHAHYPALAPIVRQCAKDHGLPYTHNGTFFQAIASHYRVMKRFGRAEGLHLVPKSAPAVPKSAPQHEAHAAE